MIGLLAVAKAYITVTCTILPRPENLVEFYAPATIEVMSDGTPVLVPL